jgi:CRISPR-associated protein Csm1
MLDSVFIALSGLVHDIGKLYQRACRGSRPEGLIDHSHPAYTAWAIQQVHRGPWPDFRQEEL